MEESSVWKGSSSQILNLGAYLLCVFGAALVLAPIGLGLAGFLPLPAFAIALALVLLLVPAGAAFWKWLHLRSRVYEITTERIQVTHGIFSRQTDSLELYRVKDMTVLRPFLLRLFGCGNVVIYTSDRTTPTFLIEAVPDPKGLNDLIRKHVEACRDKKRVGEIDMGGHAE
jgi:uncharacterized membrane protein YdbT with pleckstrin-like domain